MTTSTITPQEVKVGDEIQELSPEVYARGTFYKVTFIPVREMKTVTVYDFTTTSAHRVWVESTDQVTRLDRLDPNRTIAVRSGSGRKVHGAWHRNRIIFCRANVATAGYFLSEDMGRIDCANCLTLIDGGISN